MEPKVCPECSEIIVAADNGIWLDQATTWDEYKASWTLMQFGTQVWATNGDPSPSGQGHALHEHQPEGGALA